jgi:hypothetical protein
MVEIEIGVLRGQCLDRRIDDPRQNGPRLSLRVQRVIITVARY